LDTLGVVSKYIAPWALCHEEIPVHLAWKTGFKYDRIQITLPSDVEIKELLNVERYETTSSGILIYELRTPNYLAFYAQVRGVCQEQHENRQIKVAFYCGKEMKYVHTFVANIYRPKLSLLSAPQEIVLMDEADVRRLVEISLKLSGFGRIQIKPEISTGGEFVAHADTLYYELMRRIISTFRLEKGESELRKDVEIDAIQLQRMAQDFVERVREGKIPFDFDKSDLEEFRTWISDADNADKVVSFVSGHLESLLIQSLLYYFERYPSDNVELGSGNPYMLIESATRRLKIRFRYRDTLMTEYPPVEVEIPIEDRRIDKSKVLQVPININWKEEMVNPPSEVQ